MNHPQSWLFGVAFVLGLVLTFALMIRRVTREVPVSASTGAASVGSAGSDPVSDETATKQIPVTGEEASTTEILAGGVDARTARGKRRRWWMVAAVMVVVAIAAGGTAWVRSQHRPGPAAPASTAPTATTPGLVTSSSLSDLLLPARQVADIIGAAKIGKTTTITALLSDGSRSIAEQECIGAWTPAQQGVYRSTGSIGAQVQILRADETPLRHIAYQSVIAYPSREGAQKLVGNQSPQWSACSGRTVTADSGAGQQPRLFTFGPVTNTDGVLSMTETSVDNAIWGCQRALTARGNIVIDVRVCRPDVANQGVDVLSGIAAKMPG